MILLTGATGHSGTEIAKELARLGVPFRALVRNKAKAAGKLPGGAEIVEGDLDKPDSLDAALAGVDHALLLSPGDEQTVELQGNFVDAAKRAGLSHLVKFGAIGTDPKSQARLLRDHAEIEEKIDAAGIPLTRLHPNVFMQNFLQSKATIDHQGAIFAPIGDSRIACVDVRDIAAVAARTLTEPGHVGKTYVITGPEALTHAEIADKLARAIGKKVAFVNLTPEQFKGALMQVGLSEWMADGLNELYAGWRTGSAAEVTDVVAVVGKKQPISFDQFAADHAAAFQ